MATPGVDVRAAGHLGLAAATASTVVINTPVSLWGYQVYNGTGSVQNAGVGETTATVFTLPFASGSTTVQTYGLELASVASKVDHTNMTIILYYSAGQQ